MWIVWTWWKKFYSAAGWLAGELIQLFLSCSISSPDFLSFFPTQHRRKKFFSYNLHLLSLALALTPLSLIAICKLCSNTVCHSYAFGSKKASQNMDKGARARKCPQQIYYSCARRFMAWPKALLLRAYFWYLCCFRAKIWEHATHPCTYVRVSHFRHCEAKPFGNNCVQNICIENVLYSFFSLPAIRLTDWLTCFFDSTWLNDRQTDRGRKITRKDE